MPRHRAPDHAKKITTANAARRTTEMSSVATSTSETATNRMPMQTADQWRTTTETYEIRDRATRFATG